MAQDLNGKHWVAELSRVSAIYGSGHILSGVMDKPRDNGSLVVVKGYDKNEYYTVGDYDGTGFEAKVIEIVETSNRTMVRFEMQKDCDAYFVDNPETMPNDFLRSYTELDNYYNEKASRARMYPMFKHDVFTVSVNAFHTGKPAVGNSVTWAQATGYSAS